MLKAIRNLDYSVILCQDIDTMRQFYQHTMGFSIYRDFGYWVEMKVGATLLTLRERGAGYDGVKEYDGQAQPTGSAALQLAFRVSPAEVDACYSELQAQGVKIIQEPTNQASQHRTLFFLDPEGNVLEIYAEI